MYPQNGGVDAAQAQALLSLGVDPARILPDLHVGAGGAAEEAAGLFANPPVAGFTQGAINAETNAGTHDMTRALNEAADLIDWFTTPQATASRLYARTASFCSGSSNNFDSWDQGRFASGRRRRRRRRWRLLRRQRCSLALAAPALTAFPAPALARSPRAQESPSSSPI
jgi:hypothetical protein